MSNQERPSAETPVETDGPVQEQDLAGRKLRTVNVEVPDLAHRTAKLAAIQSGMSFKAYMAELMLSATPFPHDRNLGEAERTTCRRQPESDRSATEGSSISSAPRSEPAAVIDDRRERRSD